MSHLVVSFDSEQDCVLQLCMKPSRELTSVRGTDITLFQMVSKTALPEKCSPCAVLTWPCLEVNRHGTRV